MSLLRSKAKMLLRMRLPPILVDCIAGRVRPSHALEGVYSGPDQIPNLTGYNCPSLLSDLERGLRRRVDSRDNAVTSLPVAVCRF